MKNIPENLPLPRTLWMGLYRRILLTGVFGLMAYGFIGAYFQDGGPWCLVGGAAVLYFLVAMLRVRLRVTEEELIYHPFSFSPFPAAKRIEWNAIREIRSKMVEAGSGASTAMLYVWTVSGRAEKEKFDINTTAFPVGNLALLAELLEQKAPRAALSEDVRRAMKRWRDALDPTVPKRKERITFTWRSKKKADGSGTEKKNTFYRNLLAVGIALFVINWFYHVLHHTDFQLARNLDLGAPKALGWKISSGLSLLIYLVWLTKVFREKKAAAWVLLKGALVSLVIVNYVLQFVMQKNVETANALMDSSPSQTRTVTVTHKFYDTYGVRTRSEYHYVCFSDQDGADYSLYVDYDFYDSVKKGSVLRLTTRAGYFGWPWIEKFEKISD